MRLSAVVLSLLVAGGLICFEAPTSASARTTSARAFASVQSLNSQVLQLALNAATCARGSGVTNNDRLLTVIDYSKASTQPRLWVLDLDDERVLFEELVAHGQGSGDNYANKFSNDDGSHQTSLGLFRTADTYVGTNGYSLRLDGLEPGVNDRARERAIVMHGAPYVNAVASRTLGRLGRSWGCPALRPAIARTLIDTIKEGSLVFAYYPDQQWLRGSRFLNGCS
jgi:L,D-transpeptidase catalytic domain